MHFVLHRLIQWQLDVYKRQAEYLKEDLLRIYTHIRLEDYRVTQADIALRAMRNLCLSYLAYTNLGNNRCV